MSAVTPFLWFTEHAEEAFAHYSRIFPGNDAPAESAESFFSGLVRVGATELIIFNGGPQEGFAFSPAISLFVTCDGQEEVDRYWDALCEGGEPGRCGWLRDRFGVTWQIVPQLFNELVASEEPGVRDRVFAAMLQMTKFDCQALLDAAAG